MNESQICGCVDVQTMRHIVEVCLLTRIDEGLKGIHEGEENAFICWKILYYYIIIHAYETI